MSLLITDGKFHGYNDDGSPLVGGLLYTYISGTTTPKATYQDVGLTQLNANPVVLDSRGEASVWPAAGAYTLQLQRPNATVVWTQDGVSDVASSLAAGSGSLIVGFVRSATGAVSRTVGAELGEQSISVNDFDTLANAITASQGKELFIPAGTTVSITATADFGTASLRFAPGGMFTVSAGVDVLIRKQIDAGEHQIFSQTGNVMVAGAVNPMWWGAVRSTPGALATPAVAASNTAAFQLAAKSFYSDYSKIAGSVATPGNGLQFHLVVPPGVWDLSNGFAAAVGVKVSGSSAAGSLLRRLTANQDAGTQIPLLTIGQSLAAGLTYQNDPTAGQSLGPLTFASAGESSAMASDLYFIDQNSTAGAFAPRYPGAQFHDLFFTSCGLAINFSNCADLTGTNIVIDMGLTAISLASCQNIRLSNTVIYDTVSQSVAIGAGVYDCSLDLQIEYPQGIAINLAGACQNLKFPNLNITQNGSTGTNVISASASNMDVEFQNAAIRNLGGCAAVSVATGLTNTVLRFKGATFDGNRTNSAYNQNINMQAFSVSSGTVVLENAEMRNMGVRSVFSGTASLIVRVLRYSNMATAASIFDLTGCTGGDAEFFGVKGDGTVPLLTGATGSATVRVKGSSDWLGAPFVDGAFYSWNVPLPGAGQLMATVTANTDGTANLRKSATVLYEVSVEALPTLTQTITSATLFASPVANTHPQVAPSLVFSGGNTTTQVVAGVSVTPGKLRVPNTYSNMSANLEYMG